MKTSYKQWVAPLSLLIFSCTVLFGWIGDGSIGNNDDAVYAWSASQMIADDTWLSYRWHGAQLEKTYPPLHFVLLRLSVTLLGESELALRLPAAIMALICVFFVYGITLGISGSALCALFAGMIVISGAVFYPLSRSVHMDMGFVAFALGAYWAYIRSWNQPKYMLLCGLCLGIAYLAKTLMVVFVLAPIAIDLLVSGRSVFRDKYFYWGSGLALGLAALWHLVRTISTGVTHFPIFGSRLVAQLEGDFSIIDMGRDLIISEKWSILLWCLGLLWLGKRFKAQRGARLMIYAVVSGIGILLVTQTVMLRYVTPLLPILAIGAGGFLGSLKTKYQIAYVALVILGLSGLFLANNIHGFFNPDFSPGAKKMARQVEQMTANSGRVVFFRGYAASFDYYFRGEVRPVTDSKMGHARYMAHGAMRNGLGVEYLPPPQMGKALSMPGTVSVTLLSFEKDLRSYLFELAALPEEKVLRRGAGAFVCYRVL